MANKQNKTYYKYKSLNGENWKYLLDIILNNRLYCAKYHELNDPMEGVFYLDKNARDIEHLERLIAGKESYTICSLSEIDNEPLMWGHYADGNRGVAIGVSISHESNVSSVIYRKNKIQDLSLVKAIDLLRYKNPDWSYEKEVRVFCKNTRYVKVEISEIIFGCRIDSEIEKLIIKLIKSINPNIKIYKQQKNREKLIVKS